MILSHPSVRHRFDDVSNSRLTIRPNGKELIVYLKCKTGSEVVPSYLYDNMIAITKRHWRKYDSYYHCSNNDGIMVYYFKMVKQ